MTSKEINKKLSALALEHMELNEQYIEQHGGKKTGVNSSAESLIGQMKRIETTFKMLDITISQYYPLITQVSGRART